MIYAVKVVKAIRRRNTIVSLLPRQISTICHLFLRKGGIITCTVSGRRQYSVDLLQAPCQLALIASDKKLLNKTTLLLQKAPPVIFPRALLLEWYLPIHLFQLET